MCGIAGFIDDQLSSEEQSETVGRMLQVITHRGPENSSFWQEEAVTLGHNRLKIIDLSDSANQPFVYGHLVLVFNGEIYNYLEIKEELLTFGYKFSTEGDTEVICAAYDKWGKNCVQRFIGMWAFALWDKREKELFCSRDRFGIKPFYYFTTGTAFYFASEYKSFKQVSKFSREPNTSQIVRGIVMAWATYSEETFYKHLKTLESGSNLLWKQGKFRIETYWDINLLDKSNINLSSDAAADKFYHLFKESVALHSRSDVQNGMCLSGGLDSSAIASMYCTNLPNTPIKTFTVYYEGKGGVDERPFVNEVVKKYANIQPYFYTPKEAEISEGFHNLAYHADVPVSGSSFLSQYFLMRLAKQNGVTVVLDGQGSDEYLGGYMHALYRLIATYIVEGKAGAAVHTFQQASNRANYNYKERGKLLAKSMVSLFTSEEEIYKLEFWNDRKFYSTLPAVSLPEKTRNRFDNYLYHQLLSNTLPTLLHFEDRNSMTFSLESRVPFLNHTLIEFAFSLSNHEKISLSGESKKVLRDALKPILPEAVYERKDKKGFVTPGEQLWLNGSLKYLLDIDYSLLDFMKKDRMKKEIEKYKKGYMGNAVKVWRIAATSYWMKNFM